MSEPDVLTLATFAQHVGSRFRVVLNDAGPVELELAEATDLSNQDPHRGERFRSEPFSLLFRAPRDAELGQQIYQLEHDVIGPLDIFLVPVGPDKEGAGMCYEAIFN